MTGEDLKNILLSIDESFASVARKLDMTPQNLDGILRTKDIKTGLIERLCKIYNKPFGYFFDEQPGVSVRTEGAFSPASATGNATVSVGDAAMAAEVKHLRELIAEKNERIADLKDHLNELRQKN